MNRKQFLFFGLLVFSVLASLPISAKADAPPAPTGLGPTNYVNGSTGSDREITLNFTLPDPGDNTVAYNIQLSASSDFSEPIVDFSSDFGLPGTRSYSTIGNPLPNHSYYWRVASVNSSFEVSDWATANAGFVAFVLDAPRSVSDWPIVSTYDNSSAYLEAFALHPVTHEPYVVYTHWYNQDVFGNPEISVVRYNGSSWVSVGSAGFASGYEVYLAFSNGNPLIAFTHNENNEVASSQAMRFSGSSWESLGQVNSGSCSATRGFEVSPSTGSFYVLLSNCGMTQVYTYSGSNWTQVGGDIPSNSDILALDLNPISNQPWVATYDTDNSYFKVFVYGSDWDQVGSSIASNVGSFPSIDISASGVPYFSFECGDGIPSICTKRYVNSDWEDLGGGNTAYNRVSIKFNHLNEPLAMKSVGGKLGVLKYNDGSQWDSVGSEWFTRIAYYNAFMAFNSGTNEPWVAFYDGDVNGITVMRHETSGGGGSNTAVPTTIGPSNRTDGSATTITTPTFTFTLPDPGDGSVGYRIQISASSDFSDPVVDYTSAQGAPGNVAFTVGQPTSGGTYNAGNEDQTLSSGSYYWRISSVDSSSQQSDWVTANEGGVAFSVASLSTNTMLNFTLDINATIAIACDPSVTMNALVGTGRSTINDNNQADCTVTTNNSSGYKMQWQASTDDMINATSDHFAAYSPSASTTPETWSIPNTNSAWGAKLAATSEGYNGGSGGSGYTYPGTGWGTDDSYANGKFLNVSTTPFQIISKSSETDVDGETQSVMFGAQIGHDKIQPTGTYSVNVTMTATTL